jgi:hypothetical protein
MSFSISVWQDQRILAYQLNVSHNVKVITGYTFYHCHTKLFLIGKISYVKYFTKTCNLGTLLSCSQFRIAKNTDWHKFKLLLYVDPLLGYDRETNN